MITTGRREHITLVFSPHILSIKKESKTHRSLTLSSSVVRRGDALEPLLSCSVPPVTHRERRRWAMSHQTWLRLPTLIYGNNEDSQLEAERNAEHLEALHLKVDADRCLVVLIERIFAKSGNKSRWQTRERPDFWYDFFVGNQISRHESQQVF